VIVDRVFARVKAFLEANGYETKMTHGASSPDMTHRAASDGTDREPLGNPSLIAPSPQHVDDLLEWWGPQIEGGEEAGSIEHDLFVSATAAIVGSYGKDANKHYPKYIEWCGYIERATDPNTLKTWRSFLAGTSVGWSRLCQIAGYVPDDTFPPLSETEQAALNAAIDNPPDDLSENALSRRFADLHGGNVRFTAKEGQWLEWGETRWRPDERLNMMTLAKQFCRQIAHGGGLQ
jgi:hypothetical protein